MEQHVKLDPGVKKVILSVDGKNATVKTPRRRKKAKPKKPRLVDILRHQQDALRSNTPNIGILSLQADINSIKQKLFSDAPQQRSITKAEAQIPVRHIYNSQLNEYNLSMIPERPDSPAQSAISSLTDPVYYAPRKASEVPMSSPFDMYDEAESVAPTEFQDAQSVISSLTDPSYRAPRKASEVPMSSPFNMYDEAESVVPTEASDPSFTVSDSSKSTAASVPSSLLDAVVSVDSSESKHTGVQPFDDRFAVDSLDTYKTDDNTFDYPITPLSSLHGSDISSYAPSEDPELEASSLVGPKMKADEVSKLSSDSGQSSAQNVASIGAEDIRETDADDRSTDTLLRENKYVDDKRIWAYTDDETGRMYNFGGEAEDTSERPKVNMNIINETFKNPETGAPYDFMEELTKMLEAVPEDER